MTTTDDNHNHNDHDTTNNDKVPDQIEHQAYLARVEKGEDSGCPMWNNDPWADEPQQWMRALEKSNQMMGGDP